METIPKPDELLALHSVTEELFETLRRWFDVPQQVTISLEEIDSAVRELSDPVMIAAMAMRKLQALRLLSQPGVRTSTDVVITIVQDLDRALLHAPVLRLRREAADTDWDAEFAELLGAEELRDTVDAPSLGPDEGPGPTDEDGATDEESRIVRFRALHGSLHRAVRAVIEASDGEIRYLS